MHLTFVRTSRHNLHCKREHSEDLESLQLTVACTLMPFAPVLGQARWTLESQPVLEIQSESQGEATLFNRIAHVEQLRTGELLVVDGATRELRFFNAEGRFIRKRGRQGAGPGEFEGIEGVVVYPDAIYLFDANQSRITRFDLSGKLVADTNMPAGFEPSTIRQNVVAGVFRDNDGVEGVRLLRIRR